MIAMRPGKGGCGNCGAKLEALQNPSGSYLAICTGCGIVVGEGDEAERIITIEVNAGNATRIDAAPGFFAMRLTGGPAA